MSSDLWTGPGRTSAAQGELCVAVHLPARPAMSGSAYVRLEYRRAMEIAVVGAAASVQLDDDGALAALSVALTAVAPTIIAVEGTDAFLGRPVDDVLLGEIANVRRRTGLSHQRCAGQRPLPAALRRGDGAARRRRRRPAGPRRVDRRPCQPQSRHRSSIVSISINLNVNGTDYPVTVDPARNLVSVLRTEIGLTGTKEGCDDCECGACMVLIDGQPVNSCSYLAAQAADRPITTVEGVMVGAELHPLQQALLDEGGVQCGFCTPGMIMSATALLSRNASPTEEEVRIGLSGNLCRCTGYVKILAAVQRAAEAG